MIIDTHAHVNDKRLAPFAAEIADNMEGDGLLAIINVGFDMNSSREAFSLAKKYERFYAAAGIHPHDAKEAVEDDYLEIARMAAHPKTVAVGECGLDYFRNLSEKDVQRKVFARQLETAHSVKLPVIIHCRDAYEDTERILRENKRFLEYGGVMHCYSGSKETARIMLDFGLKFSFGGVLTYPNAERTREVLKYLPEDSYFFETDCPYLAPEPHRGKTNYPKFVVIAAEAAAQALGIGYDEICERAKRNALSLFTRIIID